MKNILLLFVLFNLTSCKTLLEKAFIKNPKVENTETIKSFLKKHDFSTKNSLIVKADTSNTLQALLNNMAFGYHIFDKAGNQICYNGSSTCSGVQFKQLMENNVDSFVSCKNDRITLTKILEQSYDLNEKPVDKNQLEPADYYVVAYWQKFFGGRKGYKESISWMEDAIKENKSTVKFTFIKINADLQENWGLVFGKKVNLKKTLSGKSMLLRTADLPIKR